MKPVIIRKNASILERMAPIVFISPAVMLIVLLSVIPVFYAVYLSFFRYNLLLPPGSIKFNGLENYKNMLNNATFISSIKWTVIFSISAVALNIFIGMTAALVLNSKTVERSLYYFKTILIMPMMLAPVVSATIWGLMYSPIYGVFNNILKLIGMEPVNWTASTLPARIALILVELWITTPFCMLVFMAALKTVPVEIYESADMDGANRAIIFLKITLPYIRNFIALVITIRVMDTLRSFDIVYTLTNGGPDISTETIGTTLYKTAFRYSDIGQGSAGAFMFFIVIALITIVTMKIMRREGTIE